MEGWGQGKGEKYLVTYTGPTQFAVLGLERMEAGNPGDQDSEGKSEQGRELAAEGRDLPLQVQ